MPRRTQKNEKKEEALKAPLKVRKSKSKGAKKSSNVLSFPTVLAGAFVGVCAYLARDRFAGTLNQDPTVSIDHGLALKLRFKGMSLVNRNQLHEGLEKLSQSIEADPYDPNGYNNKAGVLRMLGKTQEALETLQTGQAMTVKKYGKDYQDLSFIEQGLFYIYRDLNQPEEAVKHIERAVQLSPSADLYNSWAALDSLVDSQKKVELYNKALEVEPEHLQSFCSRFHEYALLGEWDQMQRDYKKAEDYMYQAMKNQKRTDAACLQPYQISYMEQFSAEMMRDTAKLFALREARVSEGDVLPPLDPAQIEPIYDSDGRQIRKLRVGYVSSDLQNHPVGRNMVGVFLATDKEKFDVYCFAAKHVPNDPITAYTMQITNYVDISTSTRSHVEIAKMIRDYQIDVLIDLNGWTAGRMLQIFSARVAPVQITHGLGFVGTSGVDAFDYFITDYVATPKRFDHLYTEHVVRLPVAYLPASHKKVFLSDQGEDYDPTKADKIALRQENGLPTDENVFLFCSFQSVHKISPHSFDTWMRILQASPQSVLWMTSIKETSQQRLLARAKKIHNIGPERFVFGKPQQINAHLVRAQACDLHLDSWPYNSHSTAMDVIWAGVPILAYLPDYVYPPNSTEIVEVQEVPKMCSRVSASLLHFLGMPQLIASSTDQFENEAVRLSKDQRAYGELRNELLEKRMSSTLFNLASYTRHHELAYSELLQRYIDGKPPTSLDVPILDAYKQTNNN